ncbi:GT-D fold domain-containing glycosyltransferase [Arthrobacter sp. CAU 1506]|uniref:GT-D fold domain-containing glycosyltransferase n=1 Tax=Arthrobacter sp. CAU 1506 TaxID=2560052 RepID=UPI00145FC8A2|nr:GT-D fold domain-containing glycosyltransferase [Arthrobacter sp. CAU 1506]
MSKSLKSQEDLMARQLELLEVQNDMLSKIRWHVSESRQISDEIRNGLAAPRLDEMSDFLAERQLGLVETIETVRDRKLSLARYGDGEFKLMFRLEHDTQFQRNSTQVFQALNDVVLHAMDNPDKLLVGLPHPHRDKYWTNFYSQFSGQIIKRFEALPVVGNSQATRPILFHACGPAAVDAWRSVWEGLDVTVVTGRGSRFEMVPELFDNIRSSTFEYSEPRHAFDDLPRLLKVLEGSTSDLVLISLGQAGTVLASELAMRGQWALDIGHLSNSYNQIYKGAVRPEQLPFSTVE